MTIVIGALITVITRIIGIMVKFHYDKKLKAHELELKNFEASRQAATDIRISYATLMNEYLNFCLRFGTPPKEIETQKEQIKNVLQDFHKSLIKNRIHILNEDKLSNLNLFAGAIKACIINDEQTYLCNLHTFKNSQSRVSENQQITFDHLAEEAGKIHEKIDRLAKEVDKDFEFLIKGNKGHFNDICRLHIDWAHPRTAPERGSVEPVGLGAGDFLCGESNSIWLKD